MPHVIREMTGSFAGAEGEVEYRIHFNSTSPGRAMRMPDLNQPGEPPEPAEWEITLIEQAFHLPDQREPTWVDIRKLALSPEEIAHVESWAEDLDLSDEVAEDYEDQRAAWEEYHAEQRRDPLE